MIGVENFAKSPNDLLAILHKGLDRAILLFIHSFELSNVSNDDRRSNATQSNILHKVFWKYSKI